MHRLGSTFKKHGTVIAWTHLRPVEIGAYSLLGRELHAGIGTPAMQDALEVLGRLSHLRHQLFLRNVKAHVGHIAAQLILVEVFGIDKHAVHVKDNGIEPALAHAHSPSAIHGVRNSGYNRKGARNRIDYVPPERLERTTGLEPATPTLARLCSTN